MADENITFRPATEGAGNDLIKAVNNLYSSLTGDEETTHPHETITPGDDDKTIWLTETTARKLAEAIGILADKIGDRKENTLTANINDRDYSYNTYGKQSYKIFAPHDNGQQGQALTANVPEGDEEPIPQWGNEVGGVELKDGYIKGVNFEATEDEMAFGEGFRVDAEGNTEIDGNTNIDGNTTIIGDVSIKKGTEANGGNLEVEGTLTAKGKATLSGGTETTDITADSITVGNTKIEDDKITCEQLEGNAKTATTATTAEKVSQSLEYTINGVQNSYNGEHLESVHFWAPTSSGTNGQILMSKGNTEGLAPAFVDIGDFFSYNSIKYSGVANSPVRMWVGDGGSGSVSDSDITEITGYCSIYQLTLGDIRIISARCETTSSLGVSNQGVSYVMHITNKLMEIGTVMSAFGCTFNPRSFHANNDDTSGQIDVYVGDGTDSNKMSGDHSMGYQLTTTSNENKKVTTKGNWIEFHDSNSNPPRYGIYITVIGLIPGASYEDVTYG